MCGSNVTRGETADRATRTDGRCTMRGAWRPRRAPSEMVRATAMPTGLRLVRGSLAVGATGDCSQHRATATRRNRARAPTRDSISL
eukprot:6193515-Pleurochrysis_carterae.AAC.3